MRSHKLMRSKKKRTKRTLTILPKSSLSKLIRRFQRYRVCQSMCLQLLNSRTSRLHSPAWMLFRNPIKTRFSARVDSFRRAPIPSPLSKCLTNSPLKTKFPPWIYGDWALMQVPRTMTNKINPNYSVLKMTCDTWKAHQIWRVNGAIRM